MNAQHTPGPWFIWKELAMQREGCEQDEIEDELHHDSEYDIYAGNPDECTRGSLSGHTASICTIEAENFGFYDEDDDCRAIPLANARLIAAAPDMLAALVMAREFISFERNAFADCNSQPDGTFDADAAAELADYDTALMQINAAILKATGPA